MCFTQRRSSKAIRYRLMTQLSGHTGCVQSLSMTRKGDFLASGGEALSYSLFITRKLMDVKGLMVFDYGI